MIDSWKASERACKWMTCAINAHKKANMRHLRQETANRESSGERRSKQSVPVYSNLAAVFAPSSNRPTPLATVDQSPWSSSSESGREDLIQNRGTVLQAALHVGLVSLSAFSPRDSMDSPIQTREINPFPINAFEMSFPFADVEKAINGLRSRLNRPEVKAQSGTIAWLTIFHRPVASVTCAPKRDLAFMQEVLTR